MTLNNNNNNNNSSNTTTDGSSPGVVQPMKSSPSRDVTDDVTTRRDVTDDVAARRSALPAGVTHIPDDVLKSFPHTKRVGNYLLGRTIGEGSFAKVKEGLHVVTGEQVRGVSNYLQ